MQALCKFLCSCSSACFERVSQNRIKLKQYFDWIVLRGEERRALEIEIEYQQSREITSETRDLRNRKVLRTPASRAKIIYIIPPCASLLRSTMNQQTTTLNSIAWVLQLNNWEANWTKNLCHRDWRLEFQVKSFLRVASRFESRWKFVLLSRCFRHIFSQTARKKINYDKIKLANKHWKMMTWKLYRASGKDVWSDESWEWHCSKKGSIDDSTS